ncbi:MAG: XdhC family protein [Anaerorhabdus sp.]
MSNTYLKILELLQQNKSLVLVSIIKSQGSVPRGAGANMIVLGDGSSFGTIGGGKIEYQSIIDAQVYLKEKRNHIEKFRLNLTDDLGMTCGGSADVLFHYIDANNESIELFKDIHKKSQDEKNSWMITKINSKQEIIIDTVLDNDYQINFNRSNKSELIEKEDILYYIVPLNILSKAYIFGAGHVAQATIPLLKMLGFKCVVVEDRKDLLDSIDSSIEKIHIEYDNIDEINIKDNDYVLSLSRSHQCDLQVVKVMLKKNLKYIGMMGSRAKIAMVKKELLNSGYSQNDIDKLYSPIGLDIKAINPMEIAFSIAAQLVLVRNTSEKV